jgi:glycosyltransferase involved in cell wall biosynthesis
MEAMTMLSRPIGNPDRSAADRAGPIDWLHLCNGMDPRRDGGMVPSILGLTGAIATLSDSRRVGIVSPTPSSLPASSLPPAVRHHASEHDLRRYVRDAEVVHLHGLWQGHTRRGAREARRARVPYLIAAHGMAEPWALRHKRWKKQAYLAFVEGKNLAHAACLHALARPEVGHLRALAPRVPIALVPNGVDLRPFDDLPPRSALEAEHPEVRGKFLLLFLSRLHAKKGLDLLADAFGSIAGEHPEAHLLLAGHDDGAKAPFLGRIESLGLSGRVTLLGHVAGERARIAWGAADAFVLPSYSEGFSMAVLEALAARKPALITSACHFPELADADGAVVVHPTPDDVTRGLRELLERSPAERSAMAERGRALVESRYTWRWQAERLAEVYRWAAGGGPEPRAVLEARSIEAPR